MSEIEYQFKRLFIRLESLIYRARVYLRYWLRPIMPRAADRLATAEIRAIERLIEIASDEELDRLGRAKGSGYIWTLNQLFERYELGYKIEIKD